MTAERDTFSGATWSRKAKLAIRQLTDAEQRIMQLWYLGGSEPSALADARKGLTGYDRSVSAVRRSLGLPTGQRQPVTA